MAAADARKQDMDGSDSHKCQTILQPCSPTAILPWERTVGLRRTELARSGLFAGHAPSPMATGCLLWLPSG